MATLTRRDFIKWTGVGAGTLALSELGFDLAQAYSVRQTLRIE